MKRSIARVISTRILLLLLAMLVLLFASTYLLVYFMLDNKNREYSHTMLSMYSDLLVYELLTDDVSIMSDEGRNTIKLYGDYLCSWYKLDYAYAYVPDVEKGQVYYIYYTRKENTDDTDVPQSGVIDYVLTDEELAVWNGERLFSEILTSNRYGDEISIEKCVLDQFGNRAMIGIDISFKETNAQIFSAFLYIAITIAVAILGIYLVVFYIIRKKVSQPAKEISSSMDAFITDGKRSDVKITESGSAEFDTIATAFNSMSENIDDYIKNINMLSSQKANQEAELSIASKIQQGFLPKGSLCLDKYEIFATMTPARDVGGDFYDYIELDGGKVLTVIADVSGKGMPAAMVMSVALILIRQYAKMGLSPAEILEKTNEILVEKNPAMLFVTAFIGLYDSERKTLTYANAGHNPPYIIRNGVSRLDDASGTLLGLFEGETYEEKTIGFNTGDTLFLYTDGINEATNVADEFYGEKRLEDTLKRANAEHVRDVITYICDDVKAFSNGAEQHDDITALSLKAKKTEELLLDFDINEFSKIKDKILELPMKKSLKLELCLAAEERFVNICSYAFPEGAPDGEKIRFTLEETDWIVLTLEDGGIPYDPVENTASPDEYDIDTQIGGLGNFIAAESVDDVKYEYKNGKNVTTFTKYMEE